VITWLPPGPRRRAGSLRIEPRPATPRRQILAAAFPNGAYRRREDIIDRSLRKGTSTQPQPSPSPLAMRSGIVMLNISPALTVREGRGAFRCGSPASCRRRREAARCAPQPGRLADDAFSFWVPTASDWTHCCPRRPRSGSAATSTDARARHYLARVHFEALFVSLAPPNINSTATIASLPRALRRCAGPWA